MPFDVLSSGDVLLRYTNYDFNQIRNFLFALNFFFKKRENEQKHYKKIFFVKKIFLQKILVLERNVGFLCEWLKKFQSQIWSRLFKHLKKIQDKTLESQISEKPSYEFRQVKARWYAREIIDIPQKGDFEKNKGKSEIYSLSTYIVFFWFSSYLIS